MKSALKHLKKDPILAKVISRVTPFEWHTQGALYEDLLSCIVSQQLSVKAAQTIWKRVEELVSHDFSPENIAKIEDEEFRACGMSFSKISYFKGVAKAFGEGLITHESIEKLSDKEVVIELTKLHGIGRWSAEMILIFTLNRPDVFSMGDLGLRNAVSRLYNVDRNDLARIEEISKGWKPYRSLASRYLWKSLDQK